MKLDIIHSLPDNFFNIESYEITSIFPNPTLIHLKTNSKKKPLFISSLLHGNETTSFYVLKKFLKDKSIEQLEKDIIFFIGNVEAAAKKERMLKGQPDFNRIWDGDESPAGVIAREVIEYVKKYNIYASIDIHNNTGHNPYYACINRLEKSFVALASSFAPYIVYFTEPHEVQSMAFAKFAPSVTLECGIPGVEEGIDYVTSYVNRIYEYDDLNNIDYSKNNLNVYQTHARLLLSQNINLNYYYPQPQESSYDVSLRSDIDDLNFQRVEAGEVIGRVINQEQIRVINNDNVDVSYEYLNFSDEGIVSFKKAVVPAMLTTDGDVAVADCLGYLMQENPL